MYVCVFVCVFSLWHLWVFYFITLQFSIVWMLVSMKEIGMIIHSVVGTIYKVYTTVRFSIGRPSNNNSVLEYKIASYKMSNNRISYRSIHKYFKWYYLFVIIYDLLCGRSEIWFTSINEMLYIVNVWYVIYFRSRFPEHLHNIIGRTCLCIDTTIPGNYEIEYTISLHQEF